MTPLAVVDAHGTRVVEGAPGVRVLDHAADVGVVLEACFGAEARAVLLHASNLPDAFFDLSSGIAGGVLQKLRTYGVRLAVVAAPGAVRPSRRFGEMAAEERRGRHFALFDDADAARTWLAAP